MLTQSHHRPLIHRYNFDHDMGALPAVAIALLLAAILVVAAQGTAPDATLEVWHGNVAQSR
jgi:hypothetical protein